MRTRPVRVAGCETYIVHGYCLKHDGMDGRCRRWTVELLRGAVLMEYDCSARSTLPMRKSFALHQAGAEVSHQLRHLLTRFNTMPMTFLPHRLG